MAVQRWGGVNEHVASDVGRREVWLGSGGWGMAGHLGGTDNNRVLGERQGSRTRRDLPALLQKTRTFDPLQVHCGLPTTPPSGIPAGKPESRGCQIL